MASASGTAGMKTGFEIGVMINTVMFRSHSKPMMGVAIVSTRNRMIEICVSSISPLEILSQEIIRGVSVLARHKRRAMLGK
jgi:hypothetical protein